MLIAPTTLSALSWLALLGWNPGVQPHRWSNQSFPVPYCITTNATNTNVSANGQRTAITNAINAWRATGVGGGISCTVYDAMAESGGCAPQRSNQDGHNNIYWVTNWTEGPAAIGITFSSFFNNCGTVVDERGQTVSLSCAFDADIELNDRDYFWTNTGQSGTDIESIAAHEYGHFIGLDHCDANGTCGLGTGIMNASYPGGAIRVPFNDDVQGACALYPGTPGGVGWPCSGSSQCTSGICVSATANGYCSAACGTCQQGFSCEPNPANPAQNICLRDDGLNRDLCEVCSLGLPNACANNGICVSGLPEAQGGRCATPCPNPGALDGACPNQYTCYMVSFQGGGSGNYCFPKSNNCTDLSSFTELQIGQTCSQSSPPCASGLVCILSSNVGICTSQCTGSPGQGSCPSGFACEEFNFQTGNEAFCAPPVSEGQNCSGIKACSVGHCAFFQGDPYETCYRDCTGNPGACNNAQRCISVVGASFSVCDPPGVPPRPDAGLPPDTGVSPDGGAACACDTTSSCDPNCGCDPACACACDTTTTCDRGCESCDPECDGRDAGPGSAKDSGTGPPCLCDQTFACDEGCSICDPECICACDQTFACDQGCEACDPECQDQGGGCLGCSSTEGRAGTSASALALVLLLGLSMGLLGLRRFLR